MKKIILLFTFFAIFSCNKQIEKPKKFLEEDQMTNLLYDLTLLTSSRSFIYDDSVAKNLVPQHVLTKYGLDSLSFVELNDYYIQHPEIYAKMFDTISKRFRKKVEQTELLPEDPRDTLNQNQINVIKSFKPILK